MQMPGALSSSRPPGPPTTTTSACSRSATRAGAVPGRPRVGRPVPPGLGGRHAGRAGRACRTRCAAAGALVGASDHSSTKSLYAKDPDGIEFEVCWVVPARPARRRGQGAAPASARSISKEIARYGAETRGGRHQLAGDLLIRGRSPKPGAEQLVVGGPVGLEQVPLLGCPTDERLELVGPAAG